MGWTSTVWAFREAPRRADGGSLRVDGARVISSVPAGPGSSLEFRATLGTEPVQHVGFAADFDERTMGDLQHGRDGAGLYARELRAAGGAPASSDFPSP